jgi:hemoglobin/transferrin/lactoferrin receptor protein
MATYKTSLLGATALVSALSTVSTAAAADETTNPLTLLGRIILGFGGAETVAIDTPQAVTVLDQTDIDREQAKTVGELFDMVPGVQAIGSGRVAGESFNIRGIGSLGASDESRIIVTVDGATKFFEQYRMGSFFSDPELYKRVEVLRGPASSTLYGAGALGGVINFETKDAADFVKDGDTSAIRFKAGYQSNGNEYLGSVIYATKPDDKFDTLVALNYRTAGNYVDGDGTEVVGSEFTSYSGLIKSNLHFGDDLEQNLTLSYSRWDSNMDDTQYSQTGTISGFGTVDRDITDQTLALRYRNPVSDDPMWNMDVVLAYSDTNVVQSDSNSFIPSVLFDDTTYAYKTLSLKVENTFDLSAGAYEHYLTAGIQLANQDRVADATSGSIGFHPEGTDNRAGIYAQSELILNSDLTVVTGVRADFSDLTPGDGVPATGVTNLAFSPKIAAHYQVSDAVGVFGSLAHTERAPTLDELFSYDLSDGETPALSLTPESANSAEIGFSTSHYGLWQDRDALQFKATGFYSMIDDMIARDSTAGTPYYRNVDSAKIYGIELEGAYGSELGYARLAYSDVRGFDTDSMETLSSIPARSLAMTIGSTNENLGLDYGWRGQFVDSIDYGSGDTYAGYAVHSVYMNWTPDTGALEGLQVQFSVNNLFDKSFENSLAGDKGAGRSVGITLSKAIGA